MLNEKMGLVGLKHKKLKSEVYSKANKENYYQKVKLIGKGTFGKVYLVINKKNQKKQALKEVIQDSRYKNRELIILSQLHHPNIVEMTDYYFKMGGENWVLNLIMEFMSTNLHSMIREQRKQKAPFPSRVRKLMTFQMLKSLYYLDINKICHRDLKPPNILVNNLTYQVKICDFGSAKIIQNRQNNVSYICSRYYRAPQLILGSTTYGSQIDMWSVGCVIVELLTCEPLFPGDSSVEQLIEIIKILGTPGGKQLQIQNDNGPSITLPAIKGNDLAKILERYNPEVELIDLIKSILTFSHEERPTPYQALMHPYFRDINTYTSEISKLPHLLNFECLVNKYNRKTIAELDERYNGQRKSQIKLKNHENQSKSQTLETTSTPNCIQSL